MATKSEVIQTAEFNPRIKSYLLASGALFLTVLIVGIPFLLIWFAGLGQYIASNFYNNLKCQLTTQHLEFKKGALFKVEKTIPLENIQDLTFVDNPLLKYFDLQILKIETAGQSSPQGSDMTLIGIVNAQGFRDKVLEQREAIRVSNRTSSSEADTSQEQVIELLKEIRDTLNAMKDK